ncbi:phospholipase [Guyparkeria halophila]|uniref:phospholipase D n=1 Tax=Guyparkeria halophila TaxID=47960 RepID=A0A6I6D3F3_9GAMM|nr:phospholipase D family protein [Guyparkeria halophila]QGT78685.1 phospholipase [Guyparkeria halophila]
MHPPQPPRHRRYRPGKRSLIALLSIGLIAWLAMGAWHVYKPMPGGLDVATPWVPAEEVRFLADTTYTAPDGTRVSDQRIFDAIREMIGGSQRLLVLDMFLFNNFAGETGDGHRPLSTELTQALIDQRGRQPDLKAVLITDPVNTAYGSVAADHLGKLRDEGVRVITTDLDRLRDPNPLWSGLWRLCCRWLESEPGAGWLPNPLAEDRGATLAAWMRLLNFKANHRKTVIADRGEQWIGLVTSANPHDASSRHGNVALRFAGPAALDLLATEQAAAELSGAERAFALPSPPRGDPLDSKEGRLRVLTEARIREAAVAMIQAAEDGERLDLAMFYLSHREVIDALKQAAARGVALRVLLDANHDAFGREKSGIPNRPVGMELHRAGVPVRWCDTRGEQCHSKMLLHRQADGSGRLLLGSANFTRRNLDNFNMETNVEWQAPPDHPALREAMAFFDTRWGNTNGEHHSLPFAEYADDSWWRYWRYRLMEATGLSTF